MVDKLSLVMGLEASNNPLVIWLYMSSKIGLKVDDTDVSE